MNFYEQFVQLCISNNKKPTKVTEEIGLGRGIVSNWKQRGNVPTDAIKFKICNYFGIPLNYFETQDALELANAIGSANNEKADLLQSVRDEDKILFDMARNASVDEVKAAIAFFKALKESK